MAPDLTPEELERVLLALKDHARRRKAEGLPIDQEERLIARLEVAERDLARAAAAPS